MRDRPPFKLKTFAALHNLTLFLLSLYMSIETLQQAGLSEPLVFVYHQQLFQAFKNDA